MTDCIQTDICIGNKHTDCRETGKGRVPTRRLLGGVLFDEAVSHCVDKLVHSTCKYLKTGS